jgi:hypothetical protein
MSPYLQQMHRFLLGRGQLEGKTFAEVPVAWWRARLQSALAVERLEVRTGLTECRPLIKGMQLTVCQWYRIDPKRLRMADRKKHVAEARMVAMYMCHRAGVGNQEIAEAFDRHPSVVARAISKCRCGKVTVPEALLCLLPQPQ